MGQTAKFFEIVMVVFLISVFLVICSGTKMYTDAFGIHAIIMMVLITIGMLLIKICHSSFLRCLIIGYVLLPVILNIGAIISVACKNCTLAEVLFNARYSSLITVLISLVISYLIKEFIYYKFLINKS